MNEAEKKIIYLASACLDVHNTTPTKEDPFTLLNRSYPSPSGSSNGSASPVLATLGAQEAPVQHSDNHIQVNRKQEIQKRKKGPTTRKALKKSTTVKAKERVTPLPDNMVIDYFTGKARKRLMWENPKGQFERYIRKPIEERPQGVYWEEGDSDMDFSEWEEEQVNRKTRMRRARRASKLKMRREA